MTLQASTIALRFSVCAASAILGAGCSKEASQVPPANPDARLLVASNMPARSDHPVFVPVPVVQKETLSHNAVQANVRILLDRVAALKDRASAARVLARDGSQEALAALVNALPSAPELLKAFIVESLGACPNPGASGLLLTLLDDPSEGIQLGAVRALGARSDAPAANALAQVLLDSERPEDLRIEAALALGDAAHPSAFEALARASVSSEAPIASQALQSLGKRPFQEVQSFFEQFLAHETVPHDSKVAALEALGNAEGDPSPLLLKFAANSDDELRLAAAWGLLSLRDAAPVHDPMIAWLKSEPNPEVRARLFHALQQQEGASPDAVLELARSESQGAARLPALEAAASFVPGSGHKALLDFFNHTAVPELVGIAAAGKAPDRLAAISSLGKAATPPARAALENLARTTIDPQIQAFAASALKAAGK